MARRPLKDSEYRARLEAIQQFVDFSVNKRGMLTKAQKQQISLYYNAIKEERLKAAAIYKGTRKNIREIAKQTGSKIPRARLKAIPVSTPRKNSKVSVRTRKRKIKVRNKIIIKKEKIVTARSATTVERFVYLDQTKMVLDAKSELQDKLAGYNFKYGHFSVGNNWQHRGFTDSETAIETWEIYALSYPVHDAQILKGAILTNLRNRPQVAYEELQEARRIKKLKKKKQYRLVESESWEEFIDYKRNKRRRAKQKKGSKNGKRK